MLSNLIQTFKLAQRVYYLCSKVTAGQCYVIFSLCANVSAKQ